MHLLDASITPDSNLLFCIFLPALYKAIWTYIDILGNFLHFFERIHKTIVFISKCQIRKPSSLRQICSAADATIKRNSVSRQAASLHSRIDALCSFICIISRFFLCVFLIFIVFFSFLLVELYNIFYLFTIVHAKKTLQIYGKIYHTI